MSVLLRKAAPATLMGGGLVFLLGQMLHFDRSFQGSPALVEAYVARDASTLEDYAHLDDVVDRMGNTPLHAAAFRPEGLRLYDPVPALLERTESLDARNEFGRLHKASADELARVLRLERFDLLFPRRLLGG